MPLAQAALVTADEGVDVANGHAVAGDQGCAIGQEGGDIGRDSALGEVVLSRQRLLDRRAGDTVSLSPSVEPAFRCRRAAAIDSRGQCPERCGFIADEVVRGDVGWIPWRSRINHDVGPAGMGREELLQGFGGRRRADADDDFGSEVPYEVGVAEQRVVGVDEMRVVVGAEANAAEGVCEDRVAADLGQCGHGGGEIREFAGTADDDALGSVLEQ
jgi:hypothetical protein